MKALIVLLSGFLATTSVFAGMGPFQRGASISESESGATPSAVQVEARKTWSGGEKVMVDGKWLAPGQRVEGTAARVDGKGGVVLPNGKKLTIGDRIPKEKKTGEAGL